MTDLVVDASVFVYATTATGSVADALLDRLSSAICHAPHLVDYEVGQVLRRRERAGKITPEVALTSLKAARHLISCRYPGAGPIGDVAWELRHTITYYDAQYVALATALNAPLLTGDARLSRAPGLTCEVEVVGQP